jgi:hypothetical protein
MTDFQIDGHGGITLGMTDKLHRACGDCQLCCKLLPVESLHKIAGVKCQHQRVGKGCMIYATKPHECHWWNCRWLLDDNTGNLPRPDRAHYVLDVMPDFVHQVHEDGRRVDFPVMQIWCDPAFPNAWREPRCMAYIEWVAKERQMGTIIRWGRESALTVFAPCLTFDGEWHEVTGQIKPENEAGLKHVLGRLSDQNRAEILERVVEGGYKHVLSRMPEDPA